MRLSRTEKADLEKYAAACNMTITDYVKTLIWCQKPAKLPMKKYELMLEQLLSLNRNLKELSKQNTASKTEIDKLLQKTNLLTDEVITAIKHPFEVIDPYSAKDLERDFLRRALKTDER